MLNRIGRLLRPSPPKTPAPFVGGPAASVLGALSLRKKRVFLVGGVAGFLVVAVLLLGLLGLGGAGVAGVALGGHQLVNFAGSADFCTGCHNVHYAESVTRQASPHSEVACASCHVGEGTAAILMSKVRGLRDIVPAATGRYERPIPTPLKQRRPSRETCERCHWSEKFFGDEVRVQTSFAADESNTVQTRALVLKVDGGQKEVAEGIHWHSTARVWYLPLDDRLLKIGWVGVEDEAGNITEYVDPNRAAEVTPRRILDEKRLMDCMDCHNRVTHLVKSPNELVDAALADGSIDVGLPFIKREALNALVPQNASLDEAYAAVAKVREFYEASYPEVLREKGDAVDKAIARLREVARRTTFSDGLDWNTHLDNARHVPPDDEGEVDWEAVALLDDSPGCFRCHGNLVEADEGTRYVAESSSGRFEPARGSRAYADSTPAAGDVPGTPGERDRGPGGLEGKVARLDADCALCHYTLESVPDSPLAPATSHPIQGLDECSVCHRPEGARAFKTEHPWATNEACKSCHQTAPEPRNVPAAAHPEDAKEIPHSTEKLGDCLACHGPTRASPVKEEHPWSPNETCSACHLAAQQLRPLPSPTPSDAMEIPHSTEKLEDCLTCHGPSRGSPMKQDHPWSTSKTCADCHKPGRQLKPLPTAAPPQAPDVPHETGKLEDCLTCHSPTSTRPIAADHPWSTSQTCTECHKLAAYLKPLPAAAPPRAPQIPHATVRLDDCLTCHGPSAVRPIATDHAWSTNQTCAACHQPVATPAPLPTSPPSPQARDVAHPVQGFEACLSCHGRLGVRPVALNHPWSTNEACLACHKPSPVLPSLPASSGPLGAQVRHTLTGLGSCGTCHKPSGPGPLPANHLGRPEAFCTLCHQPAPVVPSPTPQPTPVPAITHTLTGYQDCVLCHGPSGVRPFTASHAGRANDTCLLCHQTTAPPPNSTPTPTPAPGTPPTPGPTPPAGAALYAADCAACHGASGQGTAAGPVIAGASVSATSAAVRNGVGIMPAYSVTQISQADLNTLASYVAAMSGVAPTPTPTPTPTPAATPTPAHPVGAAVYSVACATCHGASGQGTASAPAVAGLSVSTIATAVRAGPGACPPFSPAQINDADLASLAAYTSSLGSASPPPTPSPTPTPAPPSGASTYAAQCAACHGASGEGTGTGPAVAGASVLVTTSAVRNGIGIMPAYSTVQISNTDLTALANYVAGLGSPAPTPTPVPGVTPSPTPTPAPPSGASIYAAQCAGCHGASGQGTAIGPAVAGASVPVTTSAVRNGIGIMPAYSTVQISNTDLTALATYVAGMGSPAPTPTPAPTPSPTPTPVPGVTPSPTPTPAPPSGASIYAAQCAACHGAIGEGTAIGPAVAGASVPVTTSAVRNGIGIMPAYLTVQISDTDLTILANYVAGMGPATPTPTPTPAPTPTPTPPPGATVVTLLAIADVYANQNLASTNYGALTNMYVRSTTSGSPDANQRMFVRFDTSGVPAGATIQSAYLRIRMDLAPAASRSYNVHRVAASWAETTLTWSNQPAVVASATSTITTGTTANVWLQWTVTADVQAFVSSTATNNGWRIRDQGESSSTNYQSRFIAREAGTYTAQLVVTYAASGPVPTPTPGPVPTPTPTPGPLPTATPTPAPPSVRSGATLYSTYCTGCHGAATSSDIARVSISTTTSAVRTGPGSMPAYSVTTISDAELSNLASYVAGLP